MISAFFICQLTLHRFFNYRKWADESCTRWKNTMCEKYPNIGNYGPEKTSCLDTFHAVLIKTIISLRPNMYNYLTNDKCVDKKAKRSV